MLPNVFTVFTGVLPGVANMQMFLFILTERFQKMFTKLTRDSRCA